MDTFTLENDTLRLEFDRQFGTLVGLTALPGGWRILDRPQVGLSFRLLVPNPSVLGSDQFPAPAMQTWRAVAIALSHGLSGLEPIKRVFILWGAIVGVVLTVLPMMFPKHKNVFPSPAGVGLAWTFHWYYGFLMFLGGGLGLLLEKKAPKWSEEFTFPVASGWIAGESLIGVVNTIWQNWPGLAKAFFAR